MGNDDAGASGKSRAKVESGQPTDDFKRIHGIGRAVELRLHQAGVRSYAQLAALPDVEISEKARIALPKITEQDWRGQAAELAGQSSAAASETTPSVDNQHYEAFTVEFLLNDENEVRRTRVVHVRSSQEAKWPGWAAKELLDFMTERAAPRMRAETGVPAGVAVVHERVRPPGARARRPRVLKLEALPFGAAKPSWLLPAKSAFHHPRHP
jgi:hypothetical protein